MCGGREWDAGAALRSAPHRTTLLGTSPLHTCRPPRPVSRLLSEQVSAQLQGGTPQTPQQLSHALTAFSRLID